MRNFLVSLGDSFYYSLLSHELKNAQSVLDIGCGARSPIAKIPKKFYSVGADVFAQSIKQSRKHHIHDKYILGNVLELGRKVKPKSFDAVIALDLIEHLTKKEGVQLLEMIEKIARKKIIIMTPNGFYRQEPYENNPHQIHKSGWDTDDFQARGFDVYGIRGLKVLRGEYATIRWKPWFLWATLSVLSQYVLFRMPRHSHQLFAVKTL